MDSARLRRLCSLGTQIRNAIQRLTDYAVYGDGRDAGAWVASLAPFSRHAIGRERPGRRRLFAILYYRQDTELTLCDKLGGSSSVVVQYLT